MGAGSGPAAGARLDAFSPEHSWTAVVLTVDCICGESSAPYC